MHKAARPPGGLDSLNPHRSRCTWLHHHGGDVCCVFVLCVAVSSGLQICKNLPEHNLKVHILLYYKVNRHYFFDPPRSAPCQILM
jgi:hypothetical protein